MVCNSYLKTLFKKTYFWSSIINFFSKFEGPILIQLPSGLVLFNPKGFQELVALFHNFCSISTWQLPLQKFLGRSNLLEICKNNYQGNKNCLFVFSFSQRVYLEVFLVWVYNLKHMLFLQLMDTMNDCTFRDPNPAYKNCLFPQFKPQIWKHKLCLVEEWFSSSQGYVRIDL